jgi:hypothetical protein
VALSPVPIIAVVLMLTSRRARVNGPLFVLGWLAGLAVAGAIVLCAAGPDGASSSGSPATWVSWVKIVLGLLVLLVAVREFRARPKEGEQASLPKWMATIDDIGPLGALPDHRREAHRRRHQRAGQLKDPGQNQYSSERRVPTLPCEPAPRRRRSPRSRRFTRQG